MRSIDVSALLAGARFNSFHLRLLFWGALIIVFDGYDLVIYGVVLPTLMKEWSLSAVQAGLLGSCALFGMMFGALIFGPLADRIGRRKTITVCVVLFSTVTALTGFASTPTQFAVLRFVAGIGIGGVMPNVIALMNEYAPQRLRSRLIALMFTGYSLGGMVSAGLGILLIPQQGWPSVFFIAAIPLLVLPWMVRQLPESINFLLRRGYASRAQLLLANAVTSYTPHARDILRPESGQTDKVSITQLFTEQRLINTLMLWLAFCCSMLMIYGLSSWLPKLMSAAGYNTTSSIAFLLILNLGAIFGSLTGGWLADRFGLGKVLIAFLTASGLVLGLMAVEAPVAVLYVLIGVAGAGTTGAQILANAFAIQYYPPHIRSTGLGWAMGIGRIGAIAGPLVGASMHALELPLHFSFLAFAVPGLIGAAAIGVFRIRVSHWSLIDLDPERQTAASPSPAPSSSHSAEQHTDPRLWVRPPDL